MLVVILDGPGNDLPHPRSVVLVPLQKSSHATQAHASVSGSALAWGAGASASPKMDRVTRSDSGL